MKIKFKHWAIALTSATAITLSALAPAQAGVASVDLHLAAYHSHDTEHSKRDLPGKPFLINNNTPGLGVTLDSGISFGAYRNSYAEAPSHLRALRGPLMTVSFAVGVKDNGPALVAGLTQNFRGL